MDFIQFRKAVFFQKTDVDLSGAGCVTLYRHFVYGAIFITAECEVTSLQKHRRETQPDSHCM